MAEPETWFTVQSEVLVRRPGEGEPLGRLVPGRAYRIAGRLGDQVLVGGPGGEVGSVPAKHASLLPVESAPGRDQLSQSRERAPVWALAAAAAAAVVVAVAGVMLGAPSSDSSGATAASQTSPARGEPDNDVSTPGGLAVEPDRLTAGSEVAPDGWRLLYFEAFDGPDHGWPVGETGSVLGTVSWRVGGGRLAVSLRSDESPDPTSAVQYRLAAPAEIGPEVFIAAVVEEMAASTEIAALCGLFVQQGMVSYNLNLNARVVNDRPVVSLNATRSGLDAFGDILVEPASIEGVSDGPNYVALQVQQGFLSVFVNGRTVIVGVELPPLEIDAVGVSGTLSRNASCSWDDFEVRVPGG